MKRKDTFLMPDYYPHFACKMGECRSACCEKWPVTVSMHDYFDLLSLDCDAELRRQIDCGVHILKYATPERYAEITHRYDGSCHMRMPDGRCAIQASLGEDKLPEVCRLYPRAIKDDGIFECCCAASCEKVIEMLMQDKPIKFIRQPLEYTPLQNSTVNLDPDAAKRQNVGMLLINSVLDDSLSLPQRISRIAAVKGESVLECDFDDVLQSLQSFTCVSTQNDALDVVCRLLRAVARGNISIADYADQAMAVFDGKNDRAIYNSLSSEFQAAFPHWQYLFANMAANHMFFTRFPFEDGQADYNSSCMSLAIAYALSRVLSVCLIESIKTPSDLVDILAAAYRVIEHTQLDVLAPPFMKQNGFDDITAIANL